MQVQSTQAQGPRKMPSEPVIPSVPGEFYNYATEFSIDRPLGYLMKCKANKNRPVSEAPHIDQHIDLVFTFHNGVRVCSPNSAPSVKLLGDIANGDLKQTLIGRANINEALFNEMRRVRSGEALMSLCFRTADKESLELSVGTIFAVVTAVLTDSRKFGLFRVKELTPSSVKLDACHILV